MAIALPSAGLSTLHAAGLPWVYTIPLSAVLVRGVFVYYLSTRPIRRGQQIRANLNPLVSSRIIVERRKLELEAEYSKDEEKLLKQLERFWTPYRLSHRIGKHFGAPLFQARAAVNFLALVTFAEAVRSKCGTRTGLLSAMLKPIEWIGNMLPEPRPPPLWASQTVGENLQQVQEAFKQQVSQIQEAYKEHVLGVNIPPVDGEALAKSFDLVPNSATAQVNPLDTAPAIEPAIDPAADPTFLDRFELLQVDPTLRTEGFSWCPDLTIPDPTLGLPIALSVIMGASIIMRPRTVSLTDHAVGRERNPFGRLNLNTVQRISLSFAFLFGLYVAPNMPAAILLYMIPSLVVGWVQRVWLDFKMPVRTPVQPCKRLIRPRVQKEWKD